MTAAARPHRPRTRILYAAAGLAVALLGACTGGDPGPATTAPPSGSSAGTTTSAAPSTTTTSAPSQTTPVDPVIAMIPAAARPETPDGSVAFAEYFVRQINVGFTQANPNALDGLFSPSCKACHEFVSGAQELKKRGFHHKGTSLKSMGANSNEFTSQVRSVAVLVAQESVPVVDAKGRTVRRTKAGNGTLLATLAFEDHWVVINLQVAK